MTKTVSAGFLFTSSKFTHGIGKCCWLRVWLAALKQVLTFLFTLTFEFLILAEQLIGQLIAYLDKQQRYSSVSHKRCRCRCCGRLTLRSRCDVCSEFQSHSWLNYLFWVIIIVIIITHSSTGDWTLEPASPVRPLSVHCTTKPLFCYWT